MLTASLLMLAQAAGAQAPQGQDEYYRVALETCMENAVADPAFRACYGAAVDAADAKLNQQWKLLMELVDEHYPAARAPLVAEERAWIAFKESSCAAFHSEGFGSMHRVIAAPGCRLEVIEHRIADLEGYISWLDIDEYEDAGTSSPNGN